MAVEFRCTSNIKEKKDAIFMVNWRHAKINLVVFRDKSNMFSVSVSSPTKTKMFSDILNLII